MNPWAAVFLLVLGFAGGWSAAKIRQVMDDRAGRDREGCPAGRDRDVLPVEVPPPPPTSGGRHPQRCNCS